MQSNFAESLRRVLVHEGGYVFNPRDPGGPTNKGITLATYRRYVSANGTVADLKAIKPDQVATVYRAQYWLTIGGDALPAGIDYAVFDYAVNSGVGRARKVLRAVLGLKPEATHAEVLLALDKRDAAKVVNAICDERLRFLQHLSTWGTFGKGWARRVSEVRGAALSMVTRGAAAAPVAIPEPQGKGEVPRNTKTQGTTGVVVAAGTAAAGKQAKDSGWHSGQIAVLAVLGVLLAIAVVVAIRWARMRRQEAVEVEPVPEVPPTVTPAVPPVNPAITNDDVPLARPPGG